MSSTLLEEKFNTLEIQCTKRLIMRVGREALAELVRERMEELNVSAPEVARRSGGLVSHGTVWNILNLRVKDIKEETLRGLARGLNLPQEYIRSRYFGESEGDDETQKLRDLMLFYFDNVPEECRLDMLASARGVYERRNINAKVHERSSARAAARAQLDADLAEHKDTVTRRREAALSPHPPDEELLPGRVVMHDADSLAKLPAVDDDEETTEKERKSA